MRWCQPFWNIWKSLGMIIPNIHISYIYIYMETSKNGNQTTNQVYDLFQAFALATRSPIGVPVWQLLDAQETKAKNYRSHHWRLMFMWPLWRLGPAWGYLFFWEIRVQLSSTHPQIGFLQGENQVFFPRDSGYHVLDTWKTQNHSGNQHHTGLLGLY